MKKIVIVAITFFLLGLSAAVGATILYNARDIEFVSSDSTWNVTNVESAIHDIKDNYIPKSDYVGNTWEFDYTGGEQSFISLFNGTYKIEIWGAQGGDAVPYSNYVNSYPTIEGGYGGYSVGNFKLNKSDIVYINVGGQGIVQSGAYPNKALGGYNGGGLSYGSDGQANISESASSGGGATHVALSSGLLKDFSEKREDLIIVAGGGGGATYYNNMNLYISSGNGGHGGGYKGNNSFNLIRIAGGQTVDVSNEYGKGGTQELIVSVLPGSFGLGGGFSKHTSGGGGGFYGGSGGNYGGGGGSGYIGNSKLTNKAMYCNNCKTSDKEETKTISNTCVSEDPVEQCSKKGHGYAKITLISID